MANIADGYLFIKSKNKELLKDLAKRIKDSPGYFSYGGSTDIQESDDCINVYFTGRWDCSSAWSYFDSLMIDEEYPYREALVESEIEGKESEEGSRYALEIFKPADQHLIIREDTSERKAWELEWDDDEEAESELRTVSSEEDSINEAIKKQINKIKTLPNIDNEMANFETIANEFKKILDIKMTATETNGFWEGSDPECGNDLYSIEYFRDDIRDHGTSFFKNVGDSLTFGQGLVIAKLVYSENIKIDDYLGKLYISLLSFKNGTQILFIDSFYIENEETKFLEDERVNRFYDFETGYEIPPNPDCLWSRILWDVKGS